MEKEISPINQANDQSQIEQLENKLKDISEKIENNQVSIASIVELFE